MLVLLLIPAAIVGVFLTELVAARRDRTRVTTGNPRTPPAEPVTPYTDGYYAATHVR